VSPKRKSVLDGAREGVEQPTYTVTDMSRYFFGMTADWVRHLERKDLIERAADRGKVRWFDLSRIEELANTLYLADHIEPQTHQRALQMVKLQAEIAGMFDVPFEYDGVEYPFTVADVAEIAGRPQNWVRMYAEELGGLKRPWDDGRVFESWRFPEEGLDERIFSLPQSVPPFVLSEAERAEMTDAQIEAARKQQAREYIEGVRERFRQMGKQ
jgi:hypothetical protein